MGHLTLVTGGARSGKSAYAESLALRAASAAGTESLAERLDRPVTYIATLTPLDEEMHDRVARHRARRPASWRTVEVSETGGDLVAAVQATDAGDVLLLDCIAVWTSDRLLALRDDEPAPEALAQLEGIVALDLAAFLDAIAEREGPAIVVTNEVGDGVVPPYALGRAYRDLLGRVNQQLSRAADEAYLVVAGRALPLPPPF